MSQADATSYLNYSILHHLTRSFREKLFPLSLPRDSWNLSLSLLPILPPMASPARLIHCRASPTKATLPERELPASVVFSATKVKPIDSENRKIVLQPRLCTLRSYGGEMVRTRKDAADVSPFFATLSDYIESSKNSHDFETISGRLAMIVFSATVIAEVATGNSVFRKMELEGLAEAAEACLGAVIFAATFAWFSSARSRVGGIFTLSCNTFIDSIIDQIVDGVFYEDEDPSDWSDEI